MRTFHDKEQNQWELEINLGGAKRVYDALGVDLLNPVVPDEQGRALMTRLLYDDLLLGQIVVCLVAPQAAKQRINEDALRELFDAKTLADAEDAFFQEFQRFFTARKRPQIAKALEIDLAERDKKTAEATESIEALERLGEATSSDSPEASDSANSTV